MGAKLNLKNPQTFNEKLQWLKLYDRKEIYTTMVDKYEVKQYVSQLIGEQYIIPTLGLWENFEDIDFESLPEQFVIKCTHDSGGVVICKDKTTIDLHAVKTKIEKCFGRNYYFHEREWPYKNVRPRIIAEEHLDVLGSEELIEYKIFCFNGEPKLFLVCQGEGHGLGRTNDFYDMDFNHIPVTTTYPNAKKTISKPKEYDELVKLAKKLSQGTTQLRVDFYVADKKIYFGELTFFHDSGYCQFKPEKYDKEFGRLINLPQK